MWFSLYRTTPSFAKITVPRFVLTVPNPKRGGISSIVALEISEHCSGNRPWLSTAAITTAVVAACTGPGSGGPARCQEPTAGRLSARRWPTPAAPATARTRPGPGIRSVIVPAPFVCTSLYLLAFRRYRSVCFGRFCGAVVVMWCGKNSE